MSKPTQKGTLPINSSSTLPVSTRLPSCHPLTHIDEFILACGWTQEPEGFVPPKTWQEAIATHNGGGTHWAREWAAVFCIRYHEKQLMLSNTKQ